MNDAWSLVLEWSARIGGPATAAELTAWLVDPFDEVGSMVRGQPRDGRIEWLQLSVHSGQLRSANLQLAEPVPQTSWSSGSGLGSFIGRSTRRPSASPGQWTGPM